MAFRLEPENSAAWRQTVEILAMAYYFSNRAKDALPLLEMALAWSKDNTNFQYTLAMAYLATHDRANARRTFARIFGLAPDSPAGLYSRRRPDEPGKICRRLRSDDSGSVEAETRPAAD